MNSLILNVAARMLMPLFLAFSVYMLLRGHNLPGGGFIGGLIGAAGFVLYAFAAGVPAAKAAVRLDPRAISVAGLAMALLSGMGGSDPFTGLWADLAGIPLSTVLLFDLGVYLAVFGAMLTLVFTIGEDL